MKIDMKIQAIDLLSPIERMWTVSGEKILNIQEKFPASSSSPVFTVEGAYQAQGWTEWTQGFQFGSAVLQFDGTRDERFLEIGRSYTVNEMASHVTHVGVHDHGFNNVSTYGNLWRLMNEGVIEEREWERHFYEMALKASGAVQAARWSKTSDGGGYMYSFNGPQSLFVDTIRTCRALSVSHQLGHTLWGEQDEKISLLGRVIEHGISTAKYNVWYGEGRDTYDLRGRTAHEALFNAYNGVFRAPSTQQGYSPFSTWTRGLAWAMVGFVEELEFLRTRPAEELEPWGGIAEIEAVFLKAAKATCDFYIEHGSAACGVCYWDTGAPSLHKLGEDYLKRDADPFNEYEPVDSSASAIAAQGLIRLGQYLDLYHAEKDSSRYAQAGLTVLTKLLEEPYLSTDAKHQGLLLHSVYHWPNGWDHVPAEAKVPQGESSMWGDYHLREVAVLAQRLAKNETYLTFFDGRKPAVGCATV
ncbi:glycosyl hydrolase [Poriferisphaera sp. WC338]|uniref:glycosyl hydrolase n=1 Tax=Poriferisphaera sp. WC338 TaxID=3425129 RepID=UPI003D81BFFF